MAVIEEFSNLFFLAAKHGCLDEKISRAVDERVPSVIEHDIPQQTVHLPSVYQFDIYPKHTNKYLYQ